MRQRNLSPCPRPRYWGRARHGSRNVCVGANGNRSVLCCQCTRSRCPMWNQAEQNGRPSIPPISLSLSCMKSTQASCGRSTTLIHDRPDRSLQPTCGLNLELVHVLQAAVKLVNEHVVV